MGHGDVRVRRRGTLPARRRWEARDGGHGVERFVYDARGLLTEQRGESGAPDVERYAYDARGALVRKVHAEHETFWSYDDAGRVVSYGDERGELARYEYDAQGRLARWIAGGRTIREYRYQGDCARVDNRVEVRSPIFDAREVDRESRLEPVFP